jgi:hypothetical protein
MEKAARWAAFSLFNGFACKAESLIIAINGKNQHQARCTLTCLNNRLGPDSGGAEPLQKGDLCKSLRANRDGLIVCENFSFYIPLLAAYILHPTFYITSPFPDSSNKGLSVNRTADGTLPEPAAPEVIRSEADQWLYCFYIPGNRDADP